MGGLGALFIANGWWEKYNLLENARDKYNNGPRIDQNSIKEAKEAMKQYVTEQEKQDNATKVHQDELLKVNPALANDPEKLAEATKESVEFSNHFKDENVSVIKSYVDHKK